MFHGLLSLQNPRRICWPLLHAPENKHRGDGRLDDGLRGAHQAELPDVALVLELAENVAAVREIGAAKRAGDLRILRQQNVFFRPLVKRQGRWNPQPETDSIFVCSNA